MHPFTYEGPLQILSNDVLALNVPNGSVRVGGNIQIDRFLHVGKSLTMSGTSILADMNDTASVPGWHNIGTISAPADISARVSLHIIAGSQYAAKAVEDTESVDISFRRTTSRGGETTLYVSLNSGKIDGSYHTVASGNQDTVVKELKLFKVSSVENTVSYNILAYMSPNSSHTVYCQGDSRVTFENTFDLVIDPVNDMRVIHLVEEFPMRSRIHSYNVENTEVPTRGAVSILGGMGVGKNIAIGRSAFFTSNFLYSPSFHPRSVGSRIILNPSISTNTCDYAIGVESGYIWSSVERNNDNVGFKWYGGSTEIGRLDGSGQLFTAGPAFIGCGYKSVGFGKLSLFGADNSISGPHMNAFVASDTANPAFQQHVMNSNNVSWNAGLYYDGDVLKSSSKLFSAQIKKGDSSLQLNIAHDTAVGKEISVRTALELTKDGTFTFSNDIDTVIQLNNTTTGRIWTIGNYTTTSTAILSDGVHSVSMATVPLRGTCLSIGRTNAVDGDGDLGGSCVFMPWDNAGWVTAVDRSRMDDSSISVITPENALRSISQLLPVEFQWKDGTGGIHAALLPTNIFTVFPHLVHSHDTSLGVSYNELVAYLVAAVNQLKKEVDELKRNGEKT